MKQLLQACGVDAAHIGGTPDERRRQLGKLVVKVVTDLLNGKSVSALPPRPTYPDKGGSPANALSLETPGSAEAQNHAADLLAWRMGAWVPPERR
jgi:hypothetical protein